MRAVLPLLLALAACSEGSKPNTPRDAVRGFGAALAEYDYDAILPYVSGDSTDLEHLDVFLELGRANLEFRTRLIAAYGDDGWTEFNDNEEATLSVTQNRNLDRFDAVRYEVRGDSAIGTLPDDPQPLYLVNDGRRWTVDLRKSMGFSEQQLRENTTSFRRMAEIVRTAAQRIGNEGVTPATLDTELAAELWQAVRESGQTR